MVLDFVSRCLTYPIKRHASCDSKLQELQVQVEQLQSKKERLQRSIYDAIMNGEEIFPHAARWLTVAEKDMGEAEELIRGKHNLKTPYQLRKTAEKKALAIGKLCDQEVLDSVSFQPPLEPKREALPSRVLMVNQVMDALKDPNLHSIGVYGMGGVGKTTLADEVHRKAQEDKLFEIVVRIRVSPFPGIIGTQRVIANELGLIFSSKGIQRRASQLRRRLESSNVLIVLDDIWKKLDFNAIGIPSQGSFSCKTMLLSRDRDLLSIEMGAQKVFPLEPLNEDEALSLLQFSVDAAKDPEFHAVATQIAKQCYGLPLLIRKIAQKLTNKEFQLWEHTLNQLLLADIEIYRPMYNALESSYDYLTDEEMKSFFLLCALVGQSDIQVQYILILSIVLGLFEHIRTVDDARNKTLSFISSLKSKSLLLDGDMEGYVKMHDLVRNCALKFTSREQIDFIIFELPKPLNNPEVQLLSVLAGDNSIQILYLLSDGRINLKVVDLTEMRLLPLPSSIGLLSNLRTLCLQRCQFDDVAILGELINLEFLSFSFSNLVELPGEIQHLTRLKLLDLNGCSSLQVIPSNVLSKLSLLEELYVLNSFVRWNSEENANISELYSLSHLSTLEIEIQDPTMILLGFKWFSRLRRYKISIGNVWDWKGQYKRSRTLKLKVEPGVPLENGIEFMLKNCEDLYLDGVRGIESLFYVGFPELKNMHIQNDYDIEYLIQSTSDASSNAFPALESLNLSNFPRLENICRSQLRTGDFGELQILNISNCDKLTVLLSFSLGEWLHKLRELEVESCERMEGVVGEGIEDVHHNNGVIEFTQLRSLKLKKLPNLLSFCKLKENSGKVGLLFSSMVSFPNLTSLEVNHMRKVKCLFNEFEHEGSSNGCLSMFPALQSLSVTWMENLTEWKSESDSKKVFVFPCLRNVSIQYCPKLTHLPKSDPSKLVKLEMKHCEELIPIIGQKPSFASLVGLSIMGCPKLSDLQISPQSVWSFNELSVCKCEWLIRVPHDLQKVSYLTSLEMYCCRRLRCFPEDILSTLTKLQHLSVGAFSEELDDFQYLNRIKDLQRLEELEIWGSDFFGREMCFLPNQLQHLRVLKLLKIVGFTGMESLPEWLSNMQAICSMSLDYCRNLRSETTVRIIQKLPNMSHLSCSSCPLLQGSESEWLQPLQCRKIEVEISHVSKVRARLGY